eukprot:scaffold26137_cov15-Tisochrysis_lutea.AAC.1
MHKGQGPGSTTSGSDQQTRRLLHRLIHTGKYAPLPLLDHTQVFGQPHNFLAVHELCLKLLSCHSLPTMAEAATCLILPILPWLSSKPQVTKTAAALAQLLHFCTERVRMGKGQGVEAEEVTRQPYL